MESQPSLKKGNLIFLKTPLVDLIYVVKCQDGESVVATKIDSPPDQYERLPLTSVVVLAEEQEKILPRDIGAAIEKQREVVFAPPKGGKKKTQSLDKLIKRLPKTDYEEILAVLAAAGIKEGGEEG